MDSSTGLSILQIKFEVNKYLCARDYTFVLLVEGTLSSYWSVLMEHTVGHVALGGEGQKKILTARLPASWS